MSDKEFLDVIGFKGIEIPYELWCNNNLTKDEAVYLSLIRKYDSETAARIYQIGIHKSPRTIKKIKSSLQKKGYI